CGRHGSRFASAHQDVWRVVTNLEATEVLNELIPQLLGHLGNYRLSTICRDKGELSRNVIHQDVLRVLNVATEDAL
ncbi:MAG: hypothetical protein RL450_531, partial [Actinomycetota bacterium]